MDGLNHILVLVQSINNIRGNIQGRRSHRIIGGDTKKTGVWKTEVPQGGPGEEPR